MPEEARYNFTTRGTPRVLKMATTLDEYYVQTFHSWDDVEMFIAEMQVAAEKTFGPKTCYEGRDNIQ